MMEELGSMAEETGIARLQLPDPADTDPHLRLLPEGRGIHVGEWFSDGWHNITLKVRGKPAEPGCWYISTPGFSDICFVGLFVKV